MSVRKVIYVRCINCSYNNVAKGICLLDKKAIFVYTEKNHASKSFLKIYPLKDKGALVIRRIFSLVDMITKPKFSNCPNVLKIGLFR